MAGIGENVVEAVRLAGPGSPSKPSRFGRINRWGGAWVWLGGPVPPGTAGITLGCLVIVSKAAAGSDGLNKLLAHELVHVDQWRRAGTIGFLSRYLSSYVRLRLRGYGHWASYRRIPFEVEARWATRNGRWMELFDEADRRG
jgi:hypothetical protein